ncbi:hypothetical protein HWV62_45184 [Athelia sp. TMB]|nr:hypothetical protein HWV62_45184 [Athelia sp. TMB]
MGNSQSSPPTEPPRPLSNLRNNTTFPPFANLPHEDNEDDRYFADSSKSPPTPKCHWCFFGEITSSVIYRNRLRLAVKDEVGTLFPVHFYTNDRGVGQKAQCRKGDTFVALYAMQHNFSDGTVGIRVNEGDRVKILPYSMDELLQASDAIFDPERLEKCSVCGAKKDELEMKELGTCNGCKVPCYCGEQCQSKDWLGPHQNLCKIIATLLWFTVKDWETFSTYFEFSDS